jgi:WhiB family redox-sensing transcriptional regulator
MPNVAKLPLPIIESYEWQAHGACADLDSSAFFSPDAERGRKRTEREERAKQICRHCPVLERCLQHAMDAGEPYGVWGGLTAGERARLAERRLAS